MLILWFAKCTLINDRLNIFVSLLGEPVPATLELCIWSMWEFESRALMPGLRRGDHTDIDELS